MNKKYHLTSSQVKGHLDYMRQMDTILVAVGVPTREEAGARSGQSQLVNLTQEKTPGSVQDEVKEKPSTDISNTDSTETSLSENINPPGEKRRGKRSDSENGWDIPDISDLLDSLNDCDSVSDARQRIDRSTRAMGAVDDFEQKHQSTRDADSDRL